MDEILARASNQAVSFAIKSGISIASTYAIRTASKFMEKLPEDSSKKELATEIDRIRLKIKILLPSIELIKIFSKFGNNHLKNCDLLIAELTDEFNSFDALIQQTVNVESIKSSLRSILLKIDEAIPLINLSLITSGINFRTDLNGSISYNKLIKASYVLMHHESIRHTTTVVGPKFDFIFYTVFYSNNEIIWKENFARSVVSMTETGRYSYHLDILESFDDDRFHEDKPQSKSLDLAGIRKIYFTSSGKLLKLDSDQPVLILKFDEEYIGFGIYEREESDEEEEESEEEEKEEEEEGKEEEEKEAFETSLQLLEYLIRLCILQSNEETGIAAVADEKLAVYLHNEIPTSSDTLTSNLKRLEHLHIQ